MTQKSHKTEGEAKCCASPVHRTVDWNVMTSSALFQSVIYRNHSRFPHLPSCGLWPCEPLSLAERESEWVSERPHHSYSPEFFLPTNCFVVFSLRRESQSLDCPSGGGGLKGNLGRALRTTLFTALASRMWLGLFHSNHDDGIGTHNGHSKDREMLIRNLHCFCWVFIDCVTNYNLNLGRSFVRWLCRAVRFNSICSRVGDDYNCWNDDFI